MAVELRPATALLVLGAVLLAGAVGSLVVTEAVGESTVEPTYLSLEDSNQQLWSYTSTGHAFDRATLAINAIVYGEPAGVRRQLLAGSRSTWNETDPDERDVATDPTAAVATGPTVQWDLATGSKRYAYVSEGTPGNGTWLTADYQVHDGTYLGSRHHVRAYTAPGGDGEWTAMQAHHEHWDWFMGRHVVTSVDKAQSHLEREFVAGPDDLEIRRIPTEGGQSPVDRWMTVVDFRELGVTVGSLLPVALLFAVSGRFQTGTRQLRERLPTADMRTLVLAAGIVAVTLSVRVLGIQLEGALATSPKMIAFGLYPVLFVGLPVVTYLLARPLDRSRAFAGASLGFVAAVLLDYSYLGVSHLSLSMLVYRGTLAVALGLIAAGSSRTERCDPEQVSHVRLGVLLWVVATVLPLLRHTPLPV
ncbi:hypothetical protein HLRTI_001720 [Halorhabdus tiamatea SARL4B]|uniref:Conserved hypothetical membrane protein n=1 Tax=Halorhabdus tiamatea SARL4B TaxID=1033806 RepID=F7PNG0_9EURY|nr:hypothetical protein [Halorhabdus tiamatea]ERJ06241.1 hypothetical protein HLRTI_001720 [Halorhabdus tiamatea SARL4B]CCQ33801.1 conserved hypothetical membrane protein [Halorhabdus tiamatea SARL4B]